MTNNERTQIRETVSTLADSLKGQGYSEAAVRKAVAVLHGKVAARQIDPITIENPAEFNADLESGLNRSIDERGRSRVVVTYSHGQLFVMPLREFKAKTRALKRARRHLRAMRSMGAI